MYRSDLRTDFWTSNPLLWALCFGLNCVGVRWNGHSSTPPIVTRNVHGSKVHTWEPVVSPYPHPWRVNFDSDGKAAVQGGVVYTGAEAQAVTGLAGESLGAGDKVWLSVTYYNNPATPNEFVIATGAEWPDDDYETDTVPDPANPAVLPALGWCKAIVRLAEIAADGTVSQYQWSDVILPYGRTYSESMVMDHQWNASMFQHILAVRTVVRGIEIAIAPALKDVFDTGDCPK